MPDYGKKTVAELQEILKGRSLPHTGKKAELVARLNEVDKSNEAKAGMLSHRHVRDTFSYFRLTFSAITISTVILLLVTNFHAAESGLHATKSAPEPNIIEAAPVAESVPAEQALQEPAAATTTSPGMLQSSFPLLDGLWRAMSSWTQLYLHLRLIL